MPETIDVRDTRLTPLPADQLTPVMRQPGVSWYDLTLTLWNPSTETPLYVIDEIQHLRYDADRRVLLVDLSEHDEPDTPKELVEKPKPPRYTEIGPGAEVTLTYRLSSPLILADPTKPRQATTVRIPEDVASVECTIAYDDSAPAPAPSLAATDRARPRQRWGRTVRTSWAP